MAALAAACSSAFAADGYSFVTYLNGAGGYSAAGGSLSIQGVDPSKSIRVEVSPSAGPANAPVEVANPGSTVDLPFIPGLAGGDTVSVWQPADKSEGASEHVIEAPTIRYESGALKGTVPAGFTAGIQTDTACQREVQQFADVPDDFEYPFAGEDGMFMTISASNATGDVSVLTTSTAGETPCFRVNASSRISGFKVAATHLNGTTAETSKVVLRRGGTIIDQAVGDGTGVFSNSDALALPGDVVELYRPADAVAPSKSVTLPTFSSTFDTSTDAVSVSGPAASAVRITPQATVQFRLKRDLAAGTSTFDFSQAANSFPAFNILPSSAVYAEYVNPDHTLEYYVDATDVTPDEPTVVEKGIPLPPKDTSRPKLRLAFAKLLKFPAKGLTVAITADERVTYSASLTLTARGKSKSVKFASARGSIGAGTGKLKLKLTKAGSKAFRALKARRDAVLTVSATDPAGNTTTLTRSTKLRR